MRFADGGLLVMTGLIHACTLRRWTAEITEPAWRAAASVLVHTLVATAKRSCLAALAKAATTAVSTAARMEGGQTTGCPSHVVVAAALSIIVQHVSLLRALLQALTAVSRANERRCVLTAHA
jgi:hypothetical protein